MSDVQIRRAAVGDAQALTDLHLDVWEEAYSGLISTTVLAQRRKGRVERIARWRQNISNPEALTLLAWEADSGRLLGFVTGGPRRDQTSCGLPDTEIWALYVRAEVYGRGVGYALLTAAIGSLDAYLWVLDGNQRAIEFYQRQGFRFDGTSKTEPVGQERRMVRQNSPRT